MLTIGQERSAPTEIDAGEDVRVLTFTANGEYLVSGQKTEVRVWRVKDGTQVARMETGIIHDVLSLAASKNGKWIAAGTYNGVFVWNAETYEEVSKHWVGDLVRGVDFSPDSTRLVGATDMKTAIIWDLATDEQVQTLHHQDYVTAAKYSSQGDRIATATDYRPVRVWDSNDGRLLVVIEVTMAPWFNAGLLWSNDHIFVVSDEKIKEFDASTGSKVSEWPVSNTNDLSSIALPKHGDLIACSTKRAITLWDTSTHNQLDLIQHHQDIRSIALSPDGWFLASGRVGKKITIQSLSHISVSAESRRL